MANERPTAFYRLDADNATMVWMSVRAQILQLLYWSERLAHDVDLQSLALAAQPVLPHGGLDVPEVISWLPEAGRGFTDHPGIALQRNRCRLETQFEVTLATPLGDGWDIELHDAKGEVGLTLHLRVERASGVFTASASVQNLGVTELQVDDLASIVVPVPARFRSRLSMAGRWTHEFQSDHAPIGSDAWLQESRVGRTSHHAFPGVVLMTSHAVADGTALAEPGEHWGVQLAWSGNHRLLLQPSRLGSRQLQVGELLLGGEVSLMPGQRHNSPIAYLVRDGASLAGLSLRWHRFIRQTLLRKPRYPRPVQFSTWEATYFNHDAQRLAALATQAALAGTERFVLDDGWFVGRVDDRSGLGDWQPCPVRYPNGLAPLARHCEALGMQFGLWVEPEGVNENSHLFRAHPEWVLGGSGPAQPLGRNQYVLNLGLAEVRSHLFESLSTLLNSAPIAFLKWDMNRDITHAYGADGRAGTRAHVVGLYALMDRLRAAFPLLEIESCASGGARADLGMVARCDRIWVSDCNDPLARQTSQQGFLRLLPPEMMGSHVGDAVSHTTQRNASIALRTLNSLLSHMGVETDLSAMPLQDFEHLQAAIAIYKAERSWLHAGATVPLHHPDPSLLALMACAGDGNRALVCVMAKELSCHAILAPLCMPAGVGLTHNATYRVSLHPLWLPATFYAKQVSAFHQGQAVDLPLQALTSDGISLPPLLPGQGILLQLDRV
jgi:alpha-galactosidase